MFKHATEAYDETATNAERIRQEELAAKQELYSRVEPKLVPTNIVEGREGKVHAMPPGPDRWKERSRTYQGIADAFAAQWGPLL